MCKVPKHFAILYKLSKIISTLSLFFLLNHQIGGFSPRIPDLVNCFVFVFSPVEKIPYWIYQILKKKKKKRRRRKKNASKGRHIYIYHVNVSILLVDIHHHMGVPPPPHGNTRVAENNFFFFSNEVIVQHT